MSRTHDSPEENSGDVFAERLRQNALANRPAFSPELHGRILQQVRAEASARKMGGLFRYRLRIAAIAAGLLICTWVVLRPARQPVGNPTLKVTRNTVIPTDNSQPVELNASTIPAELHIKGLFSATLWPPEIALELPIDLPVSQLPADEPVAEAAPRGLPQVLIDALQQQTGDANAALAGVLPRNLRGLFGEAAQNAANK